MLSPHPAAVKCITRVAEVMDEAARRAGAPAGAINWMTTVTLEGTQELMKHRDVAVILATGGMGLVRAAYSAGKPAYGVGPGNAPGVHRAHRGRAARPSATSSPARRSTTACSARRRTPSSSTRRSPTPSGASSRRRARYFMSKAEMDAVARVLVTPQRLPNPALVGKSAAVIAEKCGISVPAGTRVLIAPLDGVGRDYPAVDREALPGPLLLRRARTGRRAASAASRSCATAGWATRCPSTRRTSR